MKLKDSLRERVTVANAGETVALACDIEIDNKGDIVWERNGVLLESIIDLDGIKVIYEGHSVNSEIRYISAIAYLLAESWCCLCKTPTFISHNTKETIS